MNYKNKLSRIILIVVFFYLLIFFINIHPIVPVDADDWGLISTARVAVPIIRGWNPSKIFPEVLMPLCGSIAAYVINPICNDYIKSIIITNALIVSIAITLYVYAFYLMIRQKAKKDMTAIWMTVIFFLCHYLIFRSGVSNNAYMFWACDMTCYYNYLIPSLLNAGIVMTIESKDFYNIPKSLKTLMLYLALFSNLFSSYILVLYVAIKILTDVTNKKCSIKNNINDLLILFVWMVAMIFEVTGGRANSKELSAQAETLIGGLFNSGLNFFEIYKHINIIFLVVSIGVIVLNFIFLHKKSNVIRWVSYVIFSFAYLMILTSRVKPVYMQRTDCIFGFVFFAILLLMISILELSSRWECLNRASLIMVLIAFSLCSTGSRTYAPSNVIRMNEQSAITLANDILHQITSSDNDKIILEVPKFNTDSNTPFPLYMGNSITATLYKHGIIDEFKDAELVPTIKYNEIYKIKVNEPKQYLFDLE